jgi:hypothetical protein
MDATLLTLKCFSSFEGPNKIVLSRLRNLHTCVHNSQKVETTQIPINR